MSFLVSNLQLKKLGMGHNYLPPKQQTHQRWTVSLNLEFVSRPNWWNSRPLGDLSQRKVGRSLRDSTRGQPWGCPLTSMCTGTHMHAYSHVTTHMHLRMHARTHPHTPKTVFKIYSVSYQFHLHPEETGLAFHGLFHARAYSVWNILIFNYSSFL